MNSQLRALLLAVFALLALGGSTAQAEVTLTTGSTAPLVHTAATLHGVAISPTGSITDNVFTTGIGSIHCSESLSTATATTTGTDKTLTITGSLVHCTTITASDTAGTPVTVTTNGCYIVANQPATIPDGSGRYTGTGSLLCPVGKQVEIEIYAAGTVTAHSVKICTLTVGEVKNNEHVIYKNVPSSPHDYLEGSGSGKTPYKSSGTCGSTEGIATFKGQGKLTSTNHDVWISD